LALAGQAFVAGDLIASSLLVLPVLDQVIDNRGVGQRRGVAQRAEIVLGDLAQDTAHDLARTRLRQARRELDLVRRGDRPDLGAHMLDQFLAQIVGPSVPSISVT
jgi:hypothetical protein